jgi:hypothetical protein
MLTLGQKKALHSAAREALGQAGYDAQELESMRRTIQQRIGGFWSAADRRASRFGFIAVMAFYEQLAGGQLTGFTKGYWGDQDHRSNPTDALLYAVRRQAAAMGLSPDGLNRFLASKHVTGGAYTNVAEAPAYWLRRLLEALKAITRRTATKGVFAHAH